MKNKGIYNKFYVHRVDKTDIKQGDNHFDCDYFVLDLTHDKHTIPALKAYAESARADGYERLADDIENKIETIK